MHCIKKVTADALQPNIYQDMNYHHVTDSGYVLAMLQVNNPDYCIMWGASILLHHVYDMTITKTTYLYTLRPEETGPLIDDKK